MSTLNQIKFKYEIYDLEDTKAREDLINIGKTAETAMSIAKGANQSLVYGDYSTLITAFNALDNETYKVGQNILIIALNVPDLWISEIADESIRYIYTSDDEFIDTLKENGFIQIGYYKLSTLETQKIDLDEVVKFDDYANSITAGVSKVNTTTGIAINVQGTLYIVRASDAEINAKSNTFKPIVPSSVDYAVKSGLSASKLTWSETEKQNARNLLGVTNELAALETSIEEQIGDIETLLGGI